MADQARALHQSLSFKSSTDRPDQEEVWNEIAQHIGKEKTKANPIYLPGSSSNRSWRIGAVAAAAVIVLGFLFYFQQFQSGPADGALKYNTIETGYGETASLTLSDDSRIVLNANSSLTYPARQPAGHDLSVRLRGEAYFDITHYEGSNRRHFTVRTPDGEVTVLGTRFTVDDHRNQTRVVLAQGKIRVEVSDTVDHTSPASYTMKPGELVRFNKNNRNYTVEQVNPEVYTSWTGKQLIFDHTPMNEVARRLEDTYGVKVVFKDARLRQRKVSGSVENEDLNTLLDALSHSLELSIHKQKDTIVFDQQSR